MISLYRRLDFHLVTLLNVSEVAASFIFGLIGVCTGAIGAAW